jgi:serine/threonine protein kinase
MKEMNLNRDQINMIDFIRKCLVYNPGERMGCEEALKHPWLANVDYRYNIEKNLKMNC